MLQIPSVLRLVSFSSKGLVGLFGGFCIGAQITASILLSGLSVAKNSLNATRTLEIVLLPTKCVPSNDSISIPYVAIMAYAALVSASLFCILRAKGFSSSSDGSPPSSDDPVPTDSTASSSASSSVRNHHAVGNQPPSPPSELASSSSTDKAPRRNRWMWLWIIPVIVVLLAAYIYFTDQHVPTKLPAVVRESPWIQPIYVLERLFFDGLHGMGHAAISCISQATIYISLHGLQQSKILLLAIGCYSSLILVKRGVQRLIGALIPTFICNDEFAQFVLGILAGSAVIIGSFSQLSWIPWGACFLLQDLYWIGCDLVSALKPTAAFYYPSSLVEIWLSFSLVERSMIIGPTVTYATVFGFTTVFLGVYALAKTLRRLILGVYSRPVFIPYVLYCFAVVIGVAHLWALVYFSVLCLEHLDPHLTSPILEHPFLSQQWQDSVQHAYSMVALQYREWKSETIDDLHNSASLLLKTLLEALIFSWATWEALSFLIVAPTAILYCYVYIPLADSCGTGDSIGNWNDFLPFIPSPHLPASVENRLAFSATAIDSQKKRSRRCSRQPPMNLTSKTNGGTRATLPVQPWDS
ncbi:hypothetical protein B0H17DRAFT_1195069 [Mycena rosella]|uniref:Uncharacterized protein n=1 Tax=Mycena rosella TaxID=1033263 RepID=A0AAD7DYJ5_MYCRO|nr:hypothetical protein B0H17DRAFT_1195069 [Mycena rosella]